MQTTQLLSNVKHLIAIASGKGGVGKSTVAANLAAALQQQGFKTGLLDADLYGPSQALMMGATSRPESVDGKFLKPVMCHNIQTMSIAYLIQNDETPVIWRGPIASSTLQQLLYNTLWDNLDYLLIDLPPGTGDIQITLTQKIPLTGAIIVTTPQDVALLDARKALEMFNKVKVPILGIIENMSHHICTQCGHQENLFGSQGGENIAQRYQVPLLGKIPLQMDIRQQCDQGTPIVLAQPQHSCTQHFLESAKQIHDRVIIVNQQKKKQFPKIVIEHS